MTYIQIPITEFDLESFKDLVYSSEEPFTWTFTAENSDEEVSVTFIKDTDDV